MKKINWKNLLTRLCSGLILLAIVILTGLMGGWWWFGFIVILSLIGLFELYRVFGVHKKAEGIAGYLAAAGFFTLLAFHLYEWIPALFAAAFIVMMAVSVLTYEKTDILKTLAPVFGLLYPVALISYLYLTRELGDGKLILWYVFIASWGSDVFAYIVGVLIGKHHMAPIVSPKKTWEGLAGGVLGAALLGGIYGAVFAQYFAAMRHPVLYSALLSGAAAVVSVFGDLTASAIKRRFDVKDYSKLIPGHGGVLDRFDSVIFVAPVIYYLAMIVAG